MCGICGYISKKKYTEGLLEEMSNTMIHRGPDDGGVFQGNLKGEYKFGIAQRRLSIQDLSQAGHQPMFNRDGGIGIVYNGEIYNFRELRKTLEKKGYSFRSDCDTEVILYLYQEYGTECFSYMNGMFALAIVDRYKQEVILARDRIGKKPLYYYRKDNQEMAFGSELKPILKFPEFHKEVRTEVISRYLCHKYVNAPDTIFKDTYKVEPGQYIIWKAGKIQKKEKYWDLLKEYKKNHTNLITDYDEAKKELKRLLFDSVKKRLIADVPVGTFLSGGVDSSLITAVAGRISKSPVNTFTIGFADKKQNEAEYAKEVAGYLKTRHRELYITEQELIEQLRDLVKYYDEPFADSSQIPTMLVSKLAREDVTVILSGDGGDEFFCGYEMYDWAYRAQKLDVLAGMGYRFCNMPGFKQSGILEKMPDKVQALLKNRNPLTKAQLFTDIRENHSTDMVLGISESAKYRFEKDIVEANICTDDWQMRRMLLDMQYGLPDDILTKVDRASMRYSLEVRCPILDYRIMEYSFRLPRDFEYHKGDKKHILKDITYELVPKALLDRPKKGFGVPLAKWLRDELHEPLLQYARTDILKRQGIFNPDKIQEFILKLDKSEVSLYNSILWSFYVFQMWYQVYVEDLWN